MNNFFELLKSNAVIFSILLSGNFSNIDLKDLKGIDYFFPSDSGFRINNEQPRSRAIGVSLTED